MPGAVTRVVVCGAGVAGSVLAGALAGRSDVELSVIERAADAGQLDAGTALNVGPNGMQALATLSPALAASVRAAAFDWTRWQVSLSDGTPLLDFPLSDIAGCAGIRIRWASLYQVLREPIEPFIRYGTTITGVQGIAEATGDGIAGPLSIDIEGPQGARRIDGVDLLVAAEGRYSPLREQLCGPLPVEHFGIAISRLLVRDTSGGLIDDYAQWFNGPHRLLAYRVPPDHVYIVSTFPLAPGEPIEPAMKMAEAIAARHRPAGRPMAPACTWLVDAMAAHVDAIHWARMQQGPVCYRGAGGRLLVIGDAADPLVPTLGQGATQALEDGVAAAEFVRAMLDGAAGEGGGPKQCTPLDVPALTARIEAARSARATFAQRLSWEASDTLLAGSDPVRDTLRKGEPAFRRSLQALFSGSHLPSAEGTRPACR
ncbi:MAG: FAD-dependent oxidoreductase [bacterium]|nr:FAD-dependent monooxygenase [Betaproteobacteria bacterium]